MCNGQVGWELQRSIQLLGEVVSCDLNSPADRRTNFSEPDAVSALINRVRPDVIVNAAAHTAVDQVEREPERARLINATTPGVLAMTANQLGALPVHYSTDYVYDGSGDAPWDKMAAIGPLSV